MARSKRLWYNKQKQKLKSGELYIMKNRILCMALVLTLLLTACQAGKETNMPSMNTDTVPSSTPTTVEQATVTEALVTAATATATPTATTAAPNTQAPTNTPVANTPTKTPSTTVSFPDTLSWETLFPIQNDGHATMTNSTAGGMTNETAEKLFDGDLSTKLCTNNTGYTITWKLDRAYPVGGYSVTTANDSAQYGRLPQGWKMEASADGKTWTTVSDVSNSRMSNSNFKEYFYAFSKPASYQYFRFTLAAPASGMTQMSEITLYGTERPQASSSVDLSNNTYGNAGIALLKNMIEDYYDRDSHVLHGEPNGDGACAVWAAASFAEALAEGYRLCPNDDLIYRTYVDVLNNCLTAYKVNGSIQTPTGTWNVSYYNATRGSAGDYYYDDDAWICLQYLNAYTLLGEESYLKRAEEMLEFFWTGWDETLGGGIYWDKSFGSKNTCANGPIAIAFLSAYEMTGKADYLTKGKQIYDWCRSTLLDNNLYSDNINVNGSINGWKAAYNQGTMLCVGSMLYRITGETRYLTQTRATYNATVSHMFRVSGNDVSMNGNPIYKAWCIGWLQRGFILYQEVDTQKATKGTDYMNKVLNKTLKTKNASGYYDPYFCTGDWSGESTADVLQPGGMASVLLLAGLLE